MSGEHILARGHINHMNRICFEECPGNRNTVYDIVLAQMNNKTSKNESPFVDPQNLLALLVARAKNEYSPDEEILHEATMYGKNLATFDPHKIGECLDEIMESENPAAALRLAQELKVLRFIFPELADTKGFWQRYKNTSSELYVHLMMTLDCVAKNSDKKDLRWAAILHDLGKPKSVWVDEDGRTRFRKGPEGQGADHEKVGCEMAAEIFQRLGLEEDRAKHICFIITMHMFEHFDDKSGARDFVKLMGGEDCAEDMLILRLGDMQGKPKEKEGEKEVKKMRKLIKKVCAQPDGWDEIDPDSEMSEVLKDFDII
jgi:putative nucleotidyltransferase with HDIG domain